MNKKEFEKNLDVALDAYWKAMSFNHFKLAIANKKGIIELFQSYVKEACDKQKEICAKKAKMLEVDRQETEGYGRWDYKISRKSIRNAPYPKGVE